MHLTVRFHVCEILEWAKLTYRDSRKISVSWGGDGGGRLQVHPELGCAITEGKQQGPLTRVRPQPGAGDASKTHVVVTLKMPLAGDRCRQVIHRVE